MVLARSSQRGGRRRLRFGVLAVLAWIVVADGVQGQPVRADLLLIGAEIHTGDGEPPTTGNVAVAGDRIVAVGDFEIGRVERKVDCRGLVVAPGFIDLHNHSDARIDSTEPGEQETRRVPRIVANPTRESACFLTQGCTTIVTGNCGGGALDVERYYDRVDKTPVGLNVAHLIPQGQVRRAVIGSTRRKGTPAEIEEMQDLVRRGMREGAWGMSTGLAYVPSAYADTEEISQLAAVVAEFDGLYASHIRGEGDTLLESIDEAISIGRASGASVHVSHFKASGHRNWGKVRAAAAAIQAAIDEGQRVTADQYPYAASSTSISSMLLPSGEREGPSREWRGRFADPEELPRLRGIVEKRLEARGEIMVADFPANPRWIGRMLSDIAEAEKRSAVDVAIDIIRTGDESGVSFSMDERDVRWVMSLPWVATASDGSVKVDDGTVPHPRSYGTFPRKLGRYAIEEHTLPLHQAIRSATGLPADILGMTDRGYLREGLVADIVVFDPETFRDVATFPAPHQLSTGVRWLIVNGEVAIESGSIVKTDAGRALRKAVR